MEGINNNKSVAGYTPSMPAIMVGGAVTLGGVFFVLASFRILPSGVNVISQCGITGNVAGSGIIAIGLASVVYGICQQSEPQPEEEDLSYVFNFHADGGGKKAPTVLPSSVKETIVTEKMSIRRTREEYKSKIKGRKLPELCGFHPFARDNFIIKMHGIAVLASLFKEKHSLENLWSCESLTSMQKKLKEIQNSPEDQKHVLIVPSHSSWSSPGHKKTECVQQHMVPICVEKIQGHLHIYMLDAMVVIKDINFEHITLEDSSAFSVTEQILSFIDACELDSERATIYHHQLQRGLASGCYTFSLKDAVYFLRDESFTKKTKISNNPLLELPKSKVKVNAILALPPESMQTTQSKELSNYQRDYPDLAKQPFGKSQTKTLASSLEKHVVLNPTKKQQQNRLINQRVLKYHVILLNVLEHFTDAEIQSLVDQSLI